MVTMEQNITIDTDYYECKISQIIRQNVQIMDNAPFFITNIIILILIGTIGNLLTFVAIINGRKR